MKLYLYVLGASSDPDRVGSTVPFEIDDELVFFGPCKIRLREKLYSKYLKGSANGSADVSGEELYIMGVNAASERRVRKIVWAGKIQTVMTFEQAFHLFSADRRFRAMFRLPHSPMHLEPLYKGEQFVGYRLRSKEHEKGDAWVTDVVPAKNQGQVRVEGRSLFLLDPSRRKDVLTRDCCFLCENIFYARGKGIEIDHEILGILRNAQPGKRGIDSYAIFGLNKNGNPDGRRGACLQLDGPSARKFVDWVAAKKRSIAVDSGEDVEPSKRKC